LASASGLSNFVRTMSGVFHVLGWMYLLLIPFLWLTKPPFTARGADGAH
jgi:hypothetical protein